ncbi:MAG: DUF4288 domain-containing protein [Planctomycetales bacterium]|nr:DUF4288 domain-containing protein [Planctomycetales bacterium]
MVHNEPKQFAAVFVLRIAVDNDPRIVTRFETYLIDASTAEDAYQQAKELGLGFDDVYRNSDGDIVKIKSLGIHDLDLVEPNGDEYPRLVSSAQFVINDGAEPFGIVPDRDQLACFNQFGKRSDLPNLDQ